MAGLCVDIGFQFLGVNAVLCGRLAGECVPQGPMPREPSLFLPLTALQPLWPDAITSILYLVSCSEQLQKCTSDHARPCSPTIKLFAGYQAPYLRWPWMDIGQVWGGPWGGPGVGTEAGVSVLCWKRGALLRDWSVSMDIATSESWLCAAQGLPAALGGLVPGPSGG